MFIGTIIENSLGNKAFLNQVKILRTYQSGDWTLHDVKMDSSLIPELANALEDGPWYVHVWQPGNDEVVVIYKDRLFTLRHSDKATWQDAVNYGRSIGIPLEQLDFPISK